jgi:hypothetical protein
MCQERKQTTRVFFVWIAANLLGLISMSATVSALPILRSISGPGSVWSTLIMTLPIGLAQWLVMRRQLPLSPI